MALEIDDLILARATRCPDHAACLVQPEMLCGVEDTIEGNGVFVSERKRLSCPYAGAFGEGLICTCQVRAELWRRYRV